MIAGVVLLLAANNAVASRRTLGACVLCGKKFICQQA